MCWQPRLEVTNKVRLINKAYPIYVYRGIVLSYSLYWVSLRFKNVRELRIMHNIRINATIYWRNLGKLICIEASFLLMPCLVLSQQILVCVSACVCVCVWGCVRARLCVPVIMCYIIFYGHNRRSYILCFYFQVYQTGNARVASSLPPPVSLFPAPLRSRAVVCLCLISF